MFDIKNFAKSSRPHFIETAFEGQVEMGFETPVFKKKKGVLGDDMFLCGRRGKPGCFSAWELPDGKIMVGLYEEAPEDLKSGNDPLLKEIDFRPGWGFEALAYLNRLLNGEP